VCVWQLRIMAANTEMAKGYNPNSRLVDDHRRRRVWLKQQGYKAQVAV
jgi:hypothetical protein